MTEKSFNIKEEVSLLRERSHEYGNYLSKHDAQFFDMRKEQDEMKGIINKLSAQIENKVSWKLFFWIFGVCVSIIGMMFSLIWAEIKDIRVTQKEQQQRDARIGESVASIEGLLRNATITK